MRRMVMNGAAPFLPEEIIINILKWLPVKSLMRFRCVCKRWKNLFKTPSFIADHLRNSSHHNPSVLFFRTFGLDPSQIRLLDCEMQVRDALPFDSLGFRHLSIIGSSNGLLCVAIHENDFPFLLWNPATRDVREVPRSSTIDCYRLGFGFSSFVNDYKIVAIYRKIGRAGVYSLRRDSWKEIEYGNILDFVTIYRDTRVSSNGAIFWNGSKRCEEREEGAIISFDIVKEVFTLIPRPTLQEDSYLYLTVYKDKLAMLYCGVGASPNIDLWVMEEDIGSSGERWSWTKKFTGGPCPWTLYFGGTIWRNEIVMFGTETQDKIGNKEPESGLCLFKLTTNEFEMVVVPNHGSCRFLNYVESLVPVGNILNIEEPWF
ncbi:F-box/kelch-repeat protein At3g06240-like [Neltuma alba]|uniref:F-box/kelch-repeat protein At3g06240-like n=1 Tax=Neltuma alba TaxID=207710 RepID=UPI0010A3811B|nr:F-box/kelch-repeat protein At3g06240-like [Prosopis alba]